MVLSTFWMAEMVTPSSSGTFRRAMLYTLVLLGSLWGLRWAAIKLVPSSGIDNPYKLYLVAPLNMEPAER